MNYQQLERDRDGYQARVKALQEELATLEQHVAELQLRCRETQNENSQLKRASAALQAEVERLRGAMEVLANEPEVGHRVSDRLRAALSPHAPGGPSYIEELHAKVAQVEAEVERQKAWAVRYAGERDEARVALHDEQEVSEQLSDQYDELCSKCVALAVEWEASDGVVPLAFAAAALRKLAGKPAQESPLDVLARIEQNACGAGHDHYEKLCGDMAKLRTLLEAAQGKEGAGNDD